MTFEEVLIWCRANRADVRGVYRGKDISISHADQRLPDACRGPERYFTGT